MPNPTPKPAALGIQDLRAIIHGLKMSGFSYIGDEVMRDRISFMIEDLPTPESLMSMADTPLDIKHIQQQVGEIMRLIETGGARDENFKVRYEVKKAMPPRYKVLKWRGAMKNKGLTSELVRISATADDHNQPRIASKALELADAALNGKVEASDIDGFLRLCSDNGFNKEAQNWMQKARDKMTGGQGGQIVKDRQKNDQSILNSLNYISQLMNAKDYDTNKIKQMITNMPESSPKTQLMNNLQQIEELEDGVHEQVTQLSNSAVSMVDQYKSTGTFPAPVAEVAETSEAPVNETGVAPEIGGEAEPQGGNGMGGSLYDSLKDAIPGPDDNMLDFSIKPDQERAENKGAPAAPEAPEMPASAAPAAAPAAAPSNEPLAWDDIKMPANYQTKDQLVNWLQNSNNVRPDELQKQLSHYGITLENIDQDTARTIAKEFGIEQNASKKVWIRVS